MPALAPLSTAIDDLAPIAAARKAAGGKANGRRNCQQKSLALSVVNPLRQWIAAYQPAAEILGKLLNDVDLERKAMIADLAGEAARLDEQIRCPASHPGDESQKGGRSPGIVQSVR